MSTLTLTIVLEADQFAEGEEAIQHFHRELLGQKCQVRAVGYTLDGTVEATATR